MPTIPPRCIDLTNREFGLWTVKARIGVVSGTTMWTCQCSCGTTRPVASSNLRRGLSLSCGCASKPPSNPPMADIRRIWKGLLDRCLKPENRNYRFYGAVGVTICERWMDFENFWTDVGPRPEGMSIDRYPIKNGPYEPGNWRWATSKMQNQNRKDNVNITLNGETLCTSEWARRSGTNRETIVCRIKKGWSPQDAVYTPPRTRPTVTVNGTTLTADEVSKLAGISRAAAYHRISRGWSPDRILAPYTSRFKREYIDGEKT